MCVVSPVFKKASYFAGLFLGLLTMLSVATPASATQTILVWGDSLSAAYGIPVEKGWVNLMQKKLGEEFEVINGSISGETTQGGLSRLPIALKNHKPDVVILELGANDGLRGISPQVTKSNLQQMIEQSQQAKAEVMLLGMKIPPNYGAAYSKVFEAQFEQLAKEYELTFIPFFLENVIEKLELLQEDELHPTSEAQPILLDALLPSIKQILKEPS